MKLLKKIKIAIVEDDVYYAESLKKHVENSLSGGDSNLTFEISHFTTAQHCLENIEKDVDIILLDYYLEDASGDVVFPGMALLKAINNYCSQCKVIIISEQSDQKVTIELFQNGIYEYIVKDEDAFFRLSSTLRRAVRDKILDLYI